MQQHNSLNEIIRHNINKVSTSTEVEIQQPYNQFEKIILETVKVVGVKRIKPITEQSWLNNKKFNRKENKTET